MSKRTSIFEDLGSIGDRLREIQRQEQRQLPAEPAKPVPAKPVPPAPADPGDFDDTYDGWYDENGRWGNCG